MIDLTIENYIEYEIWWAFAAYYKKCKVFVKQEFSYARLGIVVMVYVDGIQKSLFIPHYKIPEWNCGDVRSEVKIIALSFIESFRKDPANQGTP